MSFLSQSIERSKPRPKDLNILKLADSIGLIFQQVFYWAKNQRMRIEYIIKEQPKNRFSFTTNIRYPVK